jgi:pyrimidine-specific ribonucleoside hydrolase
MNKLILIFSLILAGFLGSSAHSGTDRLHVILDTDCAPDDMRAICMMLASPQVEVLAITTSDGMLHPDQGFLKVSALLNELGHQGILTGLGITINIDPGKCRSFCNSVYWGDTTGMVIENVSRSSETWLRAFANEDQMVTVVCLGPLSNAALFYASYPEYQQKTSSILWYNSGGLDSTSTNYFFDCEAVRKILELKIPLTIMAGSRQDAILVDTTFLAGIKLVGSRYASLLASSFQGHGLNQKLQNGELGIWDDLIPVYLGYPEYFEVQQNKNFKHVTDVYLNDYSSFQDVYPHFLKNLSGNARCLILFTIITTFIRRMLLQLWMM